jgi:hypothetical protein
MNKKIVLTIELANGIEASDIIDDINADILCRLEEDLKYIANWEWIY